MLLAPPQGCGITVTSDGIEDVILVPQARGGIGRFFVGAFLLFWLGGWFFGFTTALSKVLSGQAPLFLYLWLGGWTIGGLLAAANRVGRAAGSQRRNDHPSAPTTVTGRRVSSANLTSASRR
jgi:hypothetical protein